MVDVQSFSKYLHQPHELNNSAFPSKVHYRSMVGENTNTNHGVKSFSFFSTYANTGLLFKTGAWEKDKEKNMGVFWLLVRYHLVRTSNSFQTLSGYLPDNNFFKGYSIGLGIEINNVLNIKSYYYHYLNPGASIFDIPIFQLTFNYNLKS